MKSSYSQPLNLAGRARKLALITCGGFVLAAALITFAAGKVDFLWRGWMLGLLLTAGLTVGALALRMTVHLTGGRWGWLLERPLEAMSRTLPLVFVYWMVAACGMKRIYLWAAISDPLQAERQGLVSAAQAHAMVFKRPLLNPLAWCGASLVCFAAWALLNGLLNRLSAQWDQAVTESLDAWKERAERISGPGLVVYLLTMTLAVVLWMMSMDVTWSSSVFGLLFVVGQGYQCLAFCILVVVWLSHHEPYRSQATAALRHDLGKLTFAFVMLTAYLAFSQFLIVWSGNLPDEVSWYMDRTMGGWSVVLGIDFLSHWLVPFALLLSRELKRSRRRLAVVAVWMLLAHALDLFWMIEPNFKDSARHLHAEIGWHAYITVPAAMFALWVAWFLRELGRHSLLPPCGLRSAEDQVQEGAHEQA